MNDTSPETAALVHARLMAKTGEQRFLMGVRMHEAARRMVMASFPPDLTKLERQHLLFQRFYAPCDHEMTPAYGRFGTPAKTNSQG